MIHKFKISQIVDITPERIWAAVVGKYEILQLMPASDIASESPRYRVKSIEEKHERVVPESELSLTMRRDQSTHSRGFTDVRSALK